MRRMSCRRTLCRRGGGPSPRRRRRRLLWYVCRPVLTPSTAFLSVSRSHVLKYLGSGLAASMGANTSAGLEQGGGKVYAFMTHKGYVIIAFPGRLHLDRTKRAVDELAKELRQKKQYS